MGIQSTTLDGGEPLPYRFTVKFRGWRETFEVDVSDEEVQEALSNQRFLHRNVARLIGEDAICTSLDEKGIISSIAQKTFRHPLEDMERARSCVRASMPDKIRLTKVERFGFPRSGLMQGWQTIWNRH